MNDLHPIEWNLTTLGKCLNEKPQYGANCSSEPYSNADVRYIRITDIDDAGNLIESAKVSIKKEDAEGYYLNMHDILIARTGNTVGKSYIHSSNLLAAFAGYLIKFVINQKIASAIYIYQFTQSQIYDRWLNTTLRTGAQPNVNASEYQSIDLTLPPLSEQNKIATILTSVDTVIEKTQAQIDKLNDLKTGMMQELLTKGIGPDGKPHTEFKDSPVGRIPAEWDVKSLGAIFDLKNGVNKGKEFFGSGVPIISYRNVYDGDGIFDRQVKSKVVMTEEELKRFRVSKGDIFITRTSETPDEIGYTNVYLGDSANTVFNGFVIRGRQKSNAFDFEYCKYCFSSNSIRKQMLDNSKFTTRAGISGESLVKILISIPPLEEQTAISRSLNSIEIKTVNSHSKLEHLKNLKKALMQDLLTGKVRVTPDPE